jgi:hypothetical protein
VRRKKKKKKKKKKKGVRREGGREWEEGAMAWSLAAPPYKIVSNSSLASWPIVNSGHAHFLATEKIGARFNRFLRISSLEAPLAKISKTQRNTNLSGRIQSSQLFSAKI